MALKWCHCCNDRAITDENLRLCEWCAAAHARGVEASIAKVQWRLDDLNTKGPEWARTRVTLRMIVSDLKSLNLSLPAQPERTGERACTCRSVCGKPVAELCAFCAESAAHDAAPPRSAADLGGRAIDPRSCSNFKDDGDDGSCLYCGVFPSAHKERQG